MSRMPTFPTQRLFDPTSNRLVYVPSAQTDIRITFAKFMDSLKPLTDRRSNGDNNPLTPKS